MKPAKLLLTTLLPLLLAATPETSSQPASQPSAPITATTGTASPLPPEVLAKLTPLFDGKSLDGWTMQDKAPTALAGGQITPDFSKKLTDPSDPLAALLLSKLDPDSQKALSLTTAEPAKGAPGKPIRDARTLIAKSLSDFLDGPSIYSESLFKNVTLRDETKNLLFARIGGPAPQKFPRLNRILLEDAWPDVLKPTPSTSWTVKQSDDGPVLASTGLGRGTLFTSSDLASYRILFDIRHVSGTPDHQPCVLVFCTRPAENEKPMDAMGGVQFQVPSGGHWDYRKGFNVGNNKNFTNLLKPKFNNKEWARCEILVDNKTGTARMAVASPIGTKAIEILDFNDPAVIGHTGPFALQMHNAGLFDQYKNIQIETNPTTTDLLTTK